MSRRTRHPGLGAALLILAGCGEPPAPPPAPEPAPAPAPAPEAPPGRDLDVFVYDCEDGTRYTVAIGPEAALLLLPDGARRLPHVPSASGARYAGDDGTVFWSKGQEAMIDVDGQERSGCRSNTMAAAWESARIRGADYRAVGNEPGWHLEIEDGGETRFTGDYGELVVEFETPPATGGGGPVAVDYDWSDGTRTVRIRLRREDCADTMADVRYPLRAHVEVDGRIFEGCGRALGDAGE